MPFRIHVSVEYRRVARAFFVQLVKFGISGIVGVTTSTILFYAFKADLPIYGWGFWFVTQRQVDLVNLAFYELTTMIGGTVHFLLSKVWVFETHRNFCDGCGRKL